MFKVTCIAASAILLMAKSAFAEHNVLLVIADDMGIDASACYNVGEQQAMMPTLESLCKQGMVYENVHTAPTCSPTRASILTGRFGFRTGIGGPISAKENSLGLSSDETSLFDVLGSASYKTAVIGKWHLAGGADGFDHPSTLGVNEYFGVYRGAVKDYFIWDAIHNGNTVSVDNYATTELTDRAINWIGQQNSRWFLWLAYNAPHAPFHVPPQSLHSAGNLTNDKSAIKRNPLNYYNAMLEAMDTELGRLLASMKTETRDNTVILFVGDNGSPSSISRNIYGSKRSKGSIYDGGTHVPLIVSGPQVNAGRSNALVNTTDLFATISTIAGVSEQTLERSTAVDSIDFSGTFDGSAGSRKYSYTEHFGNKKRRPDVYGWSIRGPRYKLVAEDGAMQALFDLTADPLEQQDILQQAQSNTALAAELEQLQNAYDRIQQAGGLD